MPLVAERNHTKNRGWWLLFRRFWGDFWRSLGDFFSLSVADAGKRIGYSCFLGPGGCRAPQARKPYGRGFWGGGFVALYGRPWAKSHARDSRHTGGVGSPQTSAFRHCPGGGLTPTPTPQPGWGGWVVGSGGKRSIRVVIFFSACLLPKCGIPSRDFS